MPTLRSLSVKDQVMVAAVRIYAQAFGRPAAEWIAGQIGLSAPLTDVGCDPASFATILDWQKHPDGMHLVVRPVDGMPWMN